METSKLRGKAERLLLAVDPSLSGSGWVAFSLESGNPVSAGMIKPPGPSMVLSRRLAALQTEVEELFRSLRLENRDVLICEGPAPLVLNPNSALKLERVRGVFEALARLRGVTVPGRLNPRTVQTELLGMKGKQLSRREVKSWARETAIRLYGELLRELVLSNSSSRSARIPQDVIDAVLVGTLAVSRIRIAEKSGHSIHDVFAQGMQRKTGRRSRNARAVWSKADLARFLEKK